MKKFTSRIFAMFLAVLMICSMVPMTVFADVSVMPSLDITSIEDITLTYGTPSSSKFQKDRVFSPATISIGETVSKQGTAFFDLYCRYTGNWRATFSPAAFRVENVIVDTPDIVDIEYTLAGWNGDEGNGSPWLQINFKGKRAGTVNISYTYYLQQGSISDYHYSSYYNYHWDTNTDNTWYKYTNSITITVEPCNNHVDADGDGFCDNDGACMHDHDQNQYCTVDGCKHGSDCCPKVMAPSYDELKEIIREGIKVNCINDSASHLNSGIDYELYEDSYSISKVNRNNGEYSVLVTISPDKYVSDFNEKTGTEHSSPDLQTVTLKWNVDESKWTANQNDFPVIFEVECETQDIEPEAPTQDELDEITADGSVTLHCTNGEMVHKDGIYALDDYNVGKVTKEGDVYVAYLTVAGSDYLGEYTETYGEHEISGTASKKARLVYEDGTGWTADESLNFTFNVICETIEKAPEKPGYSELKDLFGDEAVEVACATDSNAHETKTYGLTRDSYTLGDVAGDSESGYQVSLTIKSEPYVEQYSKTYGAHIPYGSDQAVIILNYNQETKKWEMEENLPIHFDAIDKPSDVPKGLTNSQANEALDGNVSANISCITNEEHEDKTYDFIKNGFVIGDVYLNDAGEYCQDVTIDSSVYVKQYINEYGKHEVPNTVAEPVIHFTYDKEEGQWVIEEGTWELDIELKCEIPEDPDKPVTPAAPTAPKTLDELNAILGSLKDQAVLLDCQNTSRNHKDMALGLLDGTFIIGEVEGNAKDGYSVLVIVSGEGYLNTYANTYGTHSLSGAKTGTIRLEFKDGKWTLASELPVKFALMCKSSSSSSSSSSGGSSGGNARSTTDSAYRNAAGKAGKWIFEGNLFTKTDGTLPSNEYLKIGDTIYGFYTNGYAINYKHKEKYTDEAIAARGGYKDADGTWKLCGWWFQFNDGTYPTNGWEHLTYNDRADWYYFDEDGWMVDGWLNWNGNWYYLHTEYDGTRGHMYTGWHEIDGKWYYFQEDANGVLGALVTGGTTPDGNTVGADGAMIQ